MPVAKKPVAPLNRAEMNRAEMKPAEIKPAEIKAAETKAAEILREPTGPLADLGSKPGLLPRQRIKGLIRRRMIQAALQIDETQVQPASLDLRLGTKAYRVPASFLPGKGKTVEAQLSELEFDEINLEPGAVLERGTVYVVELLEHLSLPESVSALANPKSSTGRLDVFTRLIADYSDVFDSVPGGYQGKIYTEISPSSFSIRVRKGSRLNQIRFRRRRRRPSSRFPTAISWSSTSAWRSPTARSRCATA
jgi:dCTP deaminase